ncbi:unnamed protein product [Caenorhabditis bovis]|uniref:Metalloendopeptidase n=1 Tax=Caenorhabditis bovis TaxID=2654633 RepID=A0A8S1EJZ3_9PELO|nr:unnamed protein product [Caenorhabditis bovis]
MEYYIPILVCLTFFVSYIEGQGMGGWWDRRGFGSPWGKFGGRGFPILPPPRGFLIPPPVPPPGFPTGPFGGLERFTNNIFHFLYCHNRFKDISKNRRHLGRGEWRRKARMFCHRFPGHPHCRKGKIPDQNEVSDMLKKMKYGNIGQFLRRVPRIRIDDPLRNVDKRLQGFLGGFHHQFGHIDRDVFKKIKDICKSRRCKEQPENAKKSRDIITEKMIAFEQKITGKDPSDRVNLRLDRTLQLKEALLERGNLTADIVPVDNGIFDQDTLLTEEQANILLNELNKGGVGADEIPLPETDSDDSEEDTGKKPVVKTPISNPNATKARPKKSALYFEGNLIKKWGSGSPIPFVLDDSLESIDKNDVRAAIYEIEKNTCIRFRELSAPPSGSHIVYYKVDSPTFCGLSYVGRADPANPIYLSFGCDNNKGVAIHETMHALGVAHQHLRTDRDQFITINWSNIDPQQYDSFVVVDSKLYTSYGVKYAYDSIMHYNAYTAAQNFAVATMTPKNNPAVNLKLLGQRDRMAKEDIEILRKMYCMPGCEDQNVYCGAWALRNLCTNPSHNRYMANTCKKSCNLCSGNLGDLIGGIGEMVTGITSQLGLDLNDDLMHMAKGPRPDDATWNRQARRFCRRYPGHPKCRDGLPQFNDLQSIINGIITDAGKWLPKVPLIDIRDPLAGINDDLKNVLSGLLLQFGDLGKKVTGSLRNVCKRRNCLQQNEKTHKTKTDVLSRLTKFEKNMVGKDTTDKINLRFDRTLQLKQALLEKANLKGVIAPEDNGIFDRDVLLTEQQANFMLNELGKGGEGASFAGSPPARRGRASVFFEENPVQKWPTNQPVPYTFDASLSDLDKNDVNAALKEIERNTCIRFKYFANTPKGNHINYQKVDSPTFCGLSYIGRVEPANPVYLSFLCGNARGIAIHETMHALGVNHQHLRMDRDQHIKIDWSNIDPQQYDSFVVADSKLYTTYGVKYAYDSIMHYNAYTAAMDISKPTMIPLKNQQTNIGLLGQRAKMSTADIEILNKMYCKPGCEDKNVYCGAWALQGVCTNPNNNIWMAANCKKSCNLC